MEQENLCNDYKDREDFNENYDFKDYDDDDEDIYDDNDYNDGEWNEEDY